MRTLIIMQTNVNRGRSEEWAGEGGSGPSLMLAPKMNLSPNGVWAQNEERGVNLGLRSPPPT